MDTEVQPLCNKMGGVFLPFCWAVHHILKTTFSSSSDNELIGSGGSHTHLWNLRTKQERNKGPKSQQRLSHKSPDLSLCVLVGPLCPICPPLPTETFCTLHSWLCRLPAARSCMQRWNMGAGVPVEKDQFEIFQKVYIRSIDQKPLVRQSCLPTRTDNDSPVFQRGASQAKYVFSHLYNPSN